MARQTQKPQKMSSQKARQYERIKLIVQENDSANQNNKWHVSGWTHISEILGPRIDAIMKMWTSQ